MDSNNIVNLVIVSDDESNPSHNGDIKEGNSKPVHEDENNDYDLLCNVKKISKEKKKKKKNNCEGN